MVNSRSMAPSRFATLPILTEPTSTKPRSLVLQPLALHLIWPASFSYLSEWGTVRPQASPSWPRTSISTSRLAAKHSEQTTVGSACLSARLEWRSRHRPACMRTCQATLRSPLMKSLSATTARKPTTRVSCGLSVMSPIPSATWPPTRFPSV